MDLMTDIVDIIRQETEALRRIPITAAYGEAVELIHQRVHGHSPARGKVVISGMGKAGQIGHNLATTLCSTGTPAIFLHPAEAQHGDLGLLQPNDVLLLISNSAKTREILELLDLSRQLYPDLPAILLTGQPDSPLSQQVEVCLHTGNPPEVCPLGLTPTTSTTVMTVIGDILVVLLMKRIGFSKNDYAARHHSGYLGAKARKHD